MSRLWLFIVTTLHLSTQAQTSFTSFIDAGDSALSAGTPHLAVDFYTKALGSTKSYRNQALAWKKVGVTYAQHEDYDQAISALEKSYNKYKTIEDTAALAKVVANIASCFAESGQPASALPLYREALYLKRKTRSDTSKILANIGDLFVDLGRFDSASYYLKIAARIEVEREGIASISNSLGRIHLSEGRIDSAIYQFEKATNATRAPFKRALYLTSLWEAYSELGDSAAMSRAFAERSDLSFALFNAAVATKIDSVERSFEQSALKAKESELALTKRLLEAERERNVALWITSFLLLLTGLGSYTVLTGRWEKVRRRLQPDLDPKKLLSREEFNIYILLAAKYEVGQIARARQKQPTTVRSQISSICTKLGIEAEPGRKTQALENHASEYVKRNFTED